MTKDRKLDQDPETAQMVFHGKVFHRKVETGVEGQQVSPQPRKVIVVGSHRPDGTTAFRRASDVENVDLDALPQGTLEEAKELQDPAETSRSLSTATKEAGGASQTFYDTEAEFEKKGGKGKMIPIGGAFGSDVERKRILGIRVKKGRNVKERRLNRD